MPCSWLLMLLCSIEKDRVVRWWNTRRQRAYFIESKTF